MTRIPLQGKDDLEHFRATTQVNFPSDSSVDRAFIAVAREVAELLKQAYPVQADDSDRNGTIAVSAIEQEHGQIASIESLTDPVRDR